MNPDATTELRLRHLEDEIKTLTPLASDVAVLKAELHAIGQNVADLSEGVKSLRSTLVGAALTVAVSAIGFAVTILSVVH